MAHRTLRRGIPLAPGDHPRGTPVGVERPPPLRRRPHLHCRRHRFRNAVSGTVRAPRHHKCKLQMLRLEAQPTPFRLGPVVCGGLTMAHYSGFHATPSIGRMRERLSEQYADLIALGIHVMAAQNGLGEITIGDSHEYGHTHEPFDDSAINRKIADYLRTVLDLPSWHVKQSWHGMYAKLTDGKRSELVIEAEPGVTIVNGIGGGGLGMTMSFGLAEEVVAGRLQPEAVAPM